MLQHQKLPCQPFFLHLSLMKINRRNTQSQLSQLLRKNREKQIKFNFHQENIIFNFITTAQCNKPSIRFLKRQKKMEKLKENIRKIKKRKKNNLMGS